MQLDLLQRSSNASPYGNSPYRHHDVVERRPSAASLNTVQLTNPEEAAEVCNREDSAMHLADERLSNSGARHTVIPVFCQGTDTRTSSSSLKVSIPAMAARAVFMLHICMLIQPAPQVPPALCVKSSAILHTWTKSVLTVLQGTGLWLQGTRSSSSRRRSFCRSSFTATRSYETRMCRQRRRTFAMPELEPTSNNNFHVILLETQPGMSEADDGPTMRNTLLEMAANSWGKADHIMRSMMRNALHQSNRQAHDCT